MTTKKERERLFSEVQQLLDSECPRSPRRRALAQQWSEAKLELKGLRKQKQAIAAQFKNADSAAAGELRRQMSDVSTRLLQVEEKRSKLEGALLDGIQSTPKQDVPSLPAHLRPTAPPGDLPELEFADLSDESRSDWDAFVGSQPRATLYHDSRWAEVIEGVMRQRNMSLLAYSPQRQVVGILPLYRLKSWLFGDFGVSVPYVNYGGAVGQNAAIEEALMREAARRAARRGLEHLEFRDRMTRPRWNSREEKVSMLRWLPDSIGTLETELGAKLRAQWRRAQRENVVVRLGNGGQELQAFYTVFARNMRDLGTPVYDRALFEKILSLWPEDAKLLTVSIGREAVGGAFLIRHRDTMEIPWASTIREVNRLGVNMFMYWRALAWAIDQGARYFDFGRSTKGSGTYRFKRQWGAVPVQHYWHTWLPDGGKAPSLTPNNPRYQSLIKIWQRLPVRLTRWLGPPIVRNLP